ncbi:MAG: 4Fe-4S dicluster domain-containing protein [Gaiellales bacterium]|nr:MAG: 4Fe-4S dicluster domain-containing protein [Gaiellales bacterium]
MDNQEVTDPKFAKYHGVDRNQIQWNPVIDEGKCIGCGLCVTTCGRSVYKFDFENKKTRVVNPNNCLVACQTCANLCPSHAINFADGDRTREKVQKIVKDFKLLQKVKKELEERKDSLKY